MRFLLFTPLSEPSSCHSTCVVYLPSLLHACAQHTTAKHPLITFLRKLQDLVCDKSDFHAFMVEAITLNNVKFTTAEFTTRTQIKREDFFERIFCRRWIYLIRKLLRLVFLKSQSIQVLQRTESDSELLRTETSSISSGSELFAFTKLCRTSRGIRKSIRCEIELNEMLELASHETSRHRRLFSRNNPLFESLKTNGSSQRRKSLKLFKAKSQMLLELDEARTPQRNGSEAIAGY